jgi:hypothetical protein
MWAINLYEYASQHHRRWEVAAMPADTGGRLAELKALTLRCATPDHTQLDTSRKNDLRKSVERDFRNYVQGVVIRNVAVTDNDRRAMALPIRDTVRTPVGKPVGEVVADVAYIGHGQMVLIIHHVDGTPFDARANYGVRIAWDVFPFDAPAPRTAGELHRSVFTRRKRETFTFELHDAGKRAWFSLCYENRKGRAGHPGPLFSTVIS